MERAVAASMERKKAARLRTEAANLCRRRRHRGRHQLPSSSRIDLHRRSPPHWTVICTSEEIARHHRLMQQVVATAKRQNEKPG